jgi:branched-chain amino acid transport system substrate-binding protein
VQPPAARVFAAQFRRAYGRDPDAYAIYGYEAMKDVLHAIHNAKASVNDRLSVIGKLLRLRRKGTVLGNYSIDHRGDASLRTFGGYRVRRGRLVFDRVLTPSGG